MIKRAWKNIVRMRGRSFIIFTIVSVITAFSIVCLAINESSASEIEKIQSLFETVAVLTPKIYSGPAGIVVKPPKITLDVYNHIKKSPYVKASTYNIFVCMIGAEGSDKTLTDNAQNTAPDIITSTEQNCLNVHTTDNIMAIPEFFSGKSKIISGRAFNREEYENGASVIIIPDYYAETEGVKVGDTVIGISHNVYYYRFKVIGIFEADKDLEYLNAIGRTAYVPLKTWEYLNVFKLDTDDDIRADEAYLPPSFILHEPSDGAAFMQSLDELGFDKENFLLTAYDRDYKIINSTLSSLKSFSLFLIAVALLASAVLLVLLMIIFTRNRRYEIGILRSVGISKEKISVQFGIEIMLIALAGLIFGLIIGTLICKSSAGFIINSQLSNQLIKPQDENVLESKITIEAYIDAFDLNERIENFTTDLSISLARWKIALVAIIETVICLIGCFASAAYILKLEPMEILSSRVS